MIKTLIYFCLCLTVIGCFYYQSYEIVQLQSEVKVLKENVLKLDKQINVNTDGIIYIINWVNDIYNSYKT